MGELFTLKYNKLKVSVRVSDIRVSGPLSLADKLFHVVEHPW